MKYAQLGKQVLKYHVYALVECLSVNVSRIFINGRSTKIALQK